MVLSSGEGREADILQLLTKAKDEYTKVSAVPRAVQDGARPGSLAAGVGNNVCLLFVGLGSHSRRAYEYPIARLTGRPHLRRQQTDVNAPE